MPKALMNYARRVRQQVRDDGLVAGSREAIAELKRAGWRLYYGGELADWVKWYLRYEHPVIDARDVTATVPAEHFPVFHQAENHVERHLIHEFMRFVEPTDVYWDVGANIGLWSMLVGQYAGRTVCFEPDARVRPSLQRNLQENDIDARVEPYGLGDAAGTTTVQLNDRWGVEPVEIETRTASAVIEERGLTPPDVVKVDVEGFEGPVLAGFGSLLAYVRRVFVEVHPAKMPDGWDEARVIELLERTHDVAVVYDRRNQYHIEAVLRDE